MTTRLALDEPHILRSDTIGDAWFAVAGRIVAAGVPSRYDDLPIREISLVILALGLPVGRLLMIVKSAHIYETELAYIKSVLAGAEAMLDSEDPHSTGAT